jgi:hypothetical protein
MSLHFINQSRRTRQISFSKSQNQTRATNAGDSKQKTLKDDCRLLSTIFIFCHSREYDLMEFFQHEHQSFPATLSVLVTLRLAPIPRRDRVSAFKLEDQYTSNTISSRVKCMLEPLGLPLVLHILETFSISLKAMHLLTPIRPN